MNEFILKFIVDDINYQIELKDKTDLNDYMEFIHKTFEEYTVLAVYKLVN